MALDGLMVLACALATAAPPAATAPSNGPDAMANTLAVQRALLRGRQLLHEADPGAAVAVLEAQLSRINGNREYLQLLRDAYREYVKVLSFKNQQGEARKYLERLSILDPEAAREKPATATVAPSGPPVPPVKAPPKPALIARGKNPEDPFALFNENKETGPSGHDNPQRPNTEGKPVSERAGAHNQQVARNLLAQAEEEYGRKCYGKARLLFDQAYQADQQATAASKDRWAYCKLHHVVEELNRKGAAPEALADLEHEVRAALDLAPRLDATGKWLLQEINDRKKGTGTGTGDVAVPVLVSHKGRGADGWYIAETANFRVFHRQSRELAEQAAQVAEQTRAAMARKWFGRVNGDWEPKCQLYLHGDAREYSNSTGVSASSPGHSRIESERGRVIGRRIHVRCDHPGMLTGVLPHETTHVVLAGQFGGHAVPRWADEGMAVLTEPEDKVAMHRKNLARCRQWGQLFAVRELMESNDYPEARRVSAFYAQSVSLVDFLARERGSVAFAQFLRDALKDGYQAALRKHYNFRSFEELETCWKKSAFGELAESSAGLRGRMQ
jgi:hypothetical protein